VGGVVGPGRRLVELLVAPGDALLSAIARRLAKACRLTCVRQHRRAVKNFAGGKYKVMNA